MKIEDVFKATHPIRFWILMELLEEEPLYVAQLVKRLKKRGLEVDRKKISFHLSALEDYNLVKSELGLLERSESKRSAVAVRYFRLTPKAKQILSVLRELVSQ